MLSPVGAKVGDVDTFALFAGRSGSMENGNSDSFELPGIAVTLTAGRGAGVFGVIKVGGSANA